MKLVFATGNRGKIREAAEILGDGFELVSPEDLGIYEDIPETGSTLRENSILKARYIHEKTGLDCFADDTGLEVDCLGGAPGVYSARYAGEAHNFEKNIDKLLSEISKCGPAASRKARFRCVVTLITGDELHCFDGDMEGSIALERSGCGGFGYDKVFVPDGFGGKTSAELGDDMKNRISHRYKALKAMAEWLNSGRK